VYTPAHETDGTHQATAKRTKEGSRSSRAIDTGDRSVEWCREDGGQTEVLSSDENEDGSCPESKKTTGTKGTMKVTQDDALSLLRKYVEERKHVLAVFGTPSQSVARVTGTICVSVDGRGPHLLVGKEDNKSDQIKFRLSDCVFEYGDFREESDNRFEAFLVVASSKGDTLSLFEPKD
jgi:hypothetical protein